MIKKKFLGFEFVKVGEFHIGTNAFEHKGGQWVRPTQIQFIHDDCVKAECSTYLVCLGADYKKENVLYVGEYTNSLHQRWLRKHNQPINADRAEWVSWHSDNLDNNINRLLHRLIGDESIKAKGWDARTDKKKAAIESDIQTMLDDITHHLVEPEISLWLTYNPWIEISQDVTINISRAIEQRFLESVLPLPLNTKGRTKPPKNTLAVSEIALSEAEHGL